VATNPPPNPRTSIWGWTAYSLLFHRTQRGLSGEAAGRLLNCSKATVSRLESGTARLDEAQACALDKAWSTGGLFSTMLWYALLGHDPDWVKQYVDIEAEAYVIKAYEAIVVPGLIQLPEYAGGPKVMRRELARLLEASESPNIGIRVVPRSAGAHPGADGRPRDHHET
jgi:transcriptional regulator with XRE-family HTH domain